MQNRRSFLGSVIGLFVATQIPFQAIEAAIKQSGIFDPKIAGLNVAVQMSGNLSDSSYMIRAPGISVIEHPCPGKWILKCKPVLATRSLVSHGMQLLDGDGQPLTPDIRKWASSIQMCNGDKLLITYDIYIAGAERFDRLEDAIKLYQEAQHV